MPEVRMRLILYLCVFIRFCDKRMFSTIVFAFCFKSCTAVFICKIFDRGIFLCLCVCVCVWFFLKRCMPAYCTACFVFQYVVVWDFLFAFLFGMVLYYNLLK